MANKDKGVSVGKGNIVTEAVPKRPGRPKKAAKMAVNIANGKPDKKDEVEERLVEVPWRFIRVSYDTWWLHKETLL